MDLFNSLYESGVDAVKETTTSDTVAYIPGGFGKVVKAITPLSRKKKAWKIKLYSNPIKERYEIDFEGSRVTVPHHVWKSFESDLKSIGYVTVHEKEHFFNFSDEILSEAVKESEEVIQNRLGEVRDGLNNLFTDKLINECLGTAQFWKEYFGGVRLNPQDSVFSYDYKDGIDDVVKQLETASEKNLGEIENLIDLLGSHISLKDAPIFKDKKNIVSVITLSRYAGTELNFKASVDVNFVPHQKITVLTLNGDLMDELRGYCVRVVGNEVYPREKSFDTSFFIKLKQEIKDLGD